ncbi:TLC domain-containing protein 3A-like [Ylistrum balloti]|uniref:TLC domain-containing protein 3A-like n=1 Tax=Ylistrum balloti TaxID=509963 RepID=UPI002905BED5|nr:TLC domain-containing protein 3A-like [Ylistrum balloti]
MEELLLLFCGTSFYLSSFLVTKQTLLSLFRKELSDADIVAISENSWLTNAFSWFGIPYFFYDLVVMYKGHMLTFPAIHDQTFVNRIQHFVLHNKMLTVHHFFLPLIFFPVVVFLRRGIGDFFVGVFFQLEVSLPFIAARSILVQLHQKHTVLYVIVGIAMMITFFVSRILVFPYLYWHYAVYKNIPTWRVPFVIPLKCSIGCAFILCIQLYWMSKMLKGAIKLINRFKSGNMPTPEQLNYNDVATEKIN